MTDKEHEDYPRFTCPGCGYGTDELHEGYCYECYTEQYEETFAHEFERKRWAGLTDAERWNEIKRACHDHR